MKTKQVRIALIMNAEGQWAASGWSSTKGGAVPASEMEESAGCMIEGFSQTAEHLVWITADVPIPEASAGIEIAGTVEA